MPVFGATAAPMVEVPLRERQAQGFFSLLILPRGFPVVAIPLILAFAVLLVMCTPLKYVITSLTIRQGWYRAIEVESLGLYQPAFDYPQWRFKGSDSITAFNLIDGDGNEILVGMGNVLILIPTWRVWATPILGWTFKDLVVSR